jgi:hypothetical protein
VRNYRWRLEQSLELNGTIGGCCIPDEHRNAQIFASCWRTDHGAEIGAAVTDGIPLAHR